MNIIIGIGLAIPLFAALLALVGVLEPSRRLREKFFLLAAALLTADAVLFCLINIT